MMRHQVLEDALGLLALPVCEQVLLLIHPERSQAIHYQRGLNQLLPYLCLGKETFRRFLSGLPGRESRRLRTWTGGRGSLPASSAEG